MHFIFKFIIANIAIITIGIATINPQYQGVNINKTTETAMPTRIINPQSKIAHKGVNTLPKLLFTICFACSLICVLCIVLWLLKFKTIILLL